MQGLCGELRNSTFPSEIDNWPNFAVAIKPSVQVTQANKKLMRCVTISACGSSPLRIE